MNSYLVCQNPNSKLKQHRISQNLREGALKGKKKKETREEKEKERKKAGTIIKYMVTKRYWRLVV